MGVMSPLDAAMITGDVMFHPINIGALLILAPPGDADVGFADRLYREALTSTADIDPRLRRSPYRGLSTGGLWAWRDEDTVDLEQHLHRRTLPAGSGRDEMWRLVSELHGGPLDRSRPLWAAYLIDGLSDGRIAFYVKVHHVVVDGVAGLGMITDGLTPDPKRRGMPPFYAVRHTEPAEPVGPAAPDGGTALDLSAGLRWLAGATGAGVTLAGNVMAGRVRSAVATLRGHTTLPAVGAPFTPFNERLGAQRSVVGGTWVKTRIRAIQQATGTRAHDVVAAVVGGVLRAWLADHGKLPGRSLVALCPITVRAHDGGAAGAGNRFGAWLCPIGTDEADPVRRLLRVHQSMNEGKHHVARYGSGASLSLLAPSIASTILQAVVPAGPRLRTGYNLPVSSVPGPAREMYWNGAHVEEIYPVSSTFDGQTLNATACSYADRISIGYVADSEVISDIETLVPLTERCLSELEDAVNAGVAQAVPPDR